MGEDTIVRAVRQRGEKRRAVSSALPEISIPNLDEFGHQEFTEASLYSLMQRLQDPRWPRGTLNLFALEGLITALLVLPLGLQPGLWLPLIWNGSGWRLPPILQEKLYFGSFIELLMGLMRAIDRGLLENPPRFMSVLGDGEGSSPAFRTKQEWARGFGLALKNCDHIRVPSGSNVHRALCSIAAHSHSPATVRHVHLSPPSIQHTVLLLAGVRTSRGPLGRLTKVKQPEPVSTTP
jgi:yecA family protein